MRPIIEDPMDDANERPLLPIEEPDEEDPLDQDPDVSPYDYDWPQDDHDWDQDDSSVEADE